MSVPIAPGGSGPTWWSAPLLHPDRVAAVAALSVPPVPRPHLGPTGAWPKAFGENFFYILYFQEPGVAHAELDSDPARTMRRMLAGLQSSDDKAAGRGLVAPGPDGCVERV